jgi:dTMP kinase
MLKDYPGIFVTFEGIEGVGKTTNLRYLAEYLHQHNVPILITREPGGTPLADDIRHFLLAEHDEPVEPETELLLMFAARVQHLKRVIVPALEAGKLVLCDRFTDTTYAYQGAGRGIPIEKIATLESWAQGSLRPDVTILFDAPVEVALNRINARKKDRFEKEAREFFVRARNAYLDMAKEQSERFKIVNAAQSVGEVHEDLLKILNPLVEKINKS